MITSRLIAIRGEIACQTTCTARESDIRTVAIHTGYGFLSEQLFDGRKNRVLSIIDNLSRVSSTLDLRTAARVLNSYRCTDQCGKINCI
jgi:pyruvate carboxylase